LIPTSYIQEWRTEAPWPDLRQVEQDLIICRALGDLYSSPALANKIAFRGGTAIHKLLFRQPLRYSEDIDLVQTQPEAIGPTVDGIRDALSWLGKCKRTQKESSMHLIFRFAPESEPEARLNLKIELNTREHDSVYGFKKYPFEMNSRWHREKVEIISFDAEELFATKLRALLQRRKNRDLFDLNEGLNQLSMDPARVIMCFERYLAREGNQISRAAAEQRMLNKLRGVLTEDIAPLLPAGVTFSEEDAALAFGNVWRELIERIKGESWKRTEEVVEQFRQKKYPKLLNDHVFQ